MRYFATLLLTLLLQGCFATANIGKVIPVGKAGAIYTGIGIGSDGKVTVNAGGGVILNP